MYREDDKSGGGGSSKDSRRAPVLRVVRSHEEYAEEKARMLNFERFRYYGNVISLESWGIFGERQGLKGEETKEAEGPDEGMVLVDLVAKEDAASDKPLRERKGMSLQIYKWLCIMRQMCCNRSYSNFYTYEEIRIWCMVIQA